jgi:hypothetical protein
VPMDEERKKLLIAGVCLGDISLVTAAAGNVLLPYAAELDVDRLLARCGDVEDVRRQVEEGMEGHTGKSLPPRIVQATLDRAVQAGKFLSAVRCLNLLGEKDAYVDRCLAEAQRKASDGRFEEAAHSLAIAAALDHPDGLPAFQYTGPDLHAACQADPANCVTAMEAESAVLRAFKYLLPSERVHEVVAGFTHATREDLLGRVILERDPAVADFLAAFEKAHRNLVDADEHALADLASVVKKVEAGVRRFTDSLGKVSAADEAGKAALDRLRLTTAGLSREMVDLEALVRDRQFRRLVRRLEQLGESRAQLEETADILGMKGGSPGNVFDDVLGLIAELEERNILEEVKAVEERLLSVQATMLDRKVHSHEHWQYLRELAFKYPASPLVCCLRKINDVWMVVPVWDSPVARILRDRLAGAEASRSSSTE